VKSVVIIGATSALAQSISKIHALDNDHLILVGRNQERLELICKDLVIRGAGRCESYVLDLTETDKHDYLWEHIYDHVKRPDFVYIAHGILPDQKSCESSYPETFKSLQINALSVISLLTGLANRMEQDRHGKIVVISSVSGDRGRKTNYVYGTAKAMVSTFLQGLRNRLCSNNVSVVTVKPGFIDTPMTAHFKKGMLWASADKVAADIVKGVKKDKDIIYTPIVWRLIMLVIKSIPEFVFKRLSL
jgi:short-subunit dehydrogenase